MRKHGFFAVGLAALVFALASCDHDPMSIEIENGEPAPLDPITVRFYNGDELFRSVTIERGADLSAPAGPEREAEAFTHWARTTQGGEERTYWEGATLRGVPFDVSLHAVFRDASYPHEISDVSYSVPRPGVIELAWTNPKDDDFYEVLIALKTPTVFSPPASFNRENSTTIGLVWLYYENQTQVDITLIAKDVHGNMSRGVRRTVTWEWGASSDEW